jgi:hypothetical protein
VNLSALRSLVRSDPGPWGLAEHGRTEAEATRNFSQRTSPAGTLPRPRLGRYCRAGELPPPRVGVCPAGSAPFPAPRWLPASGWLGVVSAMATASTGWLPRSWAPGPDQAVPSVVAGQERLGRWCDQSGLPPNDRADRTGCSTSFSSPWSSRRCPPQAWPQLLGHDLVHRLGAAILSRPCQLL